MKPFDWIVIGIWLPLFLLNSLSWTLAFVQMAKTPRATLKASSLDYVLLGSFLVEAYRLWG